jgi:hypothetical protein
VGARAWWAAIAVLALTGACNRRAEPTPTPATQETKTETAADVASPRVRIARPGEHLRVSLHGPGMEGPQAFELEPEEARIAVVAERAAIQWVAEGDDGPTSSGHWKLLLLRLQFAGGRPGAYVVDESKTLVLSVGLRDPGGAMRTFELATGTLNATGVAMAPRTIQGSLTGELRAAGGAPGPTIEVAFDLVE